MGPQRQGGFHSESQFYPSCKLKTKKKGPLSGWGPGKNAPVAPPVGGPGNISRHTVVCRAAQEAGVPPVSILTGRKKTQFSHLCTFVITYPIGTKFAREMPASTGSLHTKFEENRSSHFRDTSEQNFALISSFFSSSFRTLRKIHHKTRMHARIGLKFGTLKGLIKADFCTNFGRNPMNIHGVMTDYLRKIRSKVCHAYRVNSFEESVEN